MEDNSVHQPQFPQRYTDPHVHTLTQTYTYTSLAHLVTWPPLSKGVGLMCQPTTVLRQAHGPPAASEDSAFPADRVWLCWSP